MADNLKLGLAKAAQQLHAAAEWVDVHAAWIEPLARCPNDDADPTLRKVTLDASVLDDFLNGLRLLGPTLERVAQALEDAPQARLHVVTGGKV